MYSTSDTIIAQISAPGYAATAQIRISGSKCFDIVAKHFSKPKNLIQAPSHSILHGFFLDVDGVQIDEVLCLIFRMPHSYTGEDCCEISTHGNPLLVGRIIEILLKNCRIAQAGEFTYRAYMNGKLDLGQAEAVNDLIKAPTELASSVALGQLRGKLTQYIMQLMEELVELRIKLELMIDFADQDLPAIENSVLIEELQQKLITMRDMHANGRQGRLLREGIKLCLTGAPNAGKSSIFNAMLEENRAIVSPHAGTTRDYLEEVIAFAGYQLIVYDTAGLRSAENDIEAIGIESTYKLLHDADLNIYIVEYERLLDETAYQDEILSLPRTLLIVNKVDLIFPQAMPTLNEWQDHIHSVSPSCAKLEKLLRASIPVSTLHFQGLKIFQEKLMEHLNLRSDISQSIIISNTRHLNALAKAIIATENALQSLHHEDGYEFTAFELISAHSALGEILGTVSTEELLGKIFSEFCIGK